MDGGRSLGDKPGIRMFEACWLVAEGEARKVRLPVIRFLCKICSCKFSCRRISPAAGTISVGRGGSRESQGCFAMRMGIGMDLMERPTYVISEISSRGT